MRPDVTLISPYPPAGERHGGHSGVASYTANLAHALADGGAGVAVVADGDGPTERDGAVTVHRAFRRGPGALPAAAAAAVRTGAPVVHLQHELFLYGGPAALPGLVPALARLGRNRRAVTTLHQVVARDEVDRGFTDLHRVRVPARAARAGLHAVQRTVQRLSDHCVVHEAPFADVLPGAHVVPHGVEDAPRGDRAAARRLTGVAGDELLVLCFGFVAPYKGLEAAIDAVAAAGRGVRLVIAGGVHPRLAAAGDDYVGDLARRAGDDVLFAGRIPDEEVAAWFTAADVALFLYPRPFSSSGALALALAHGTPALLSPELATSCGAPATMTVDRDPAAVAARLRELQHERARQALAADVAALAHARRWPSVAARHREIYETA